MEIYWRDYPAKDPRVKSTLERLEAIGIEYKADIPLSWDKNKLPQIVAKCYNEKQRRLLTHLNFIKRIDK